MSNEKTPLIINEAINKEEVINSQSTVQNTNIVLSIMNLANAAIGMAMFSLPFAFHETGLLSGILLTFVKFDF